MSNPLRLPTEERQAEIVAAALRLASDNSPALITTTDIAGAIGVTQGALFKHFAAKEAIWAAAMRWVHTELMARLVAAEASAATPLQALAAMFHAHVAFVDAHPGVPRLVFHELQQPADSEAKQQVRTLMQAYRAMLLGLLRRAQAQGQVPPALELEAAATSFVGLIQGLVMQAMLSGHPIQVRQQADSVLALYLRGVGQAA